MCPPTWRNHTVHSYLLASRRSGDESVRVPSSRPRPEGPKQVTPLFRAFFLPKKLPTNPFTIFICHPALSLSSRKRGTRGPGLDSRVRGNDSKTFGCQFRVSCVPVWAAKLPLTTLSVVVGLACISVRGPPSLSPLLRGRWWGWHSRDYYGSRIFSYFSIV